MTESCHVARLQAVVASAAAMLDQYVRFRLRTPGLSMVEPVRGDLGPPVEGSAFDALVAWFGLSPFEQAVLAIAAGVEISPDVASQCALAQGDPAMPFPTSLLALAAFSELDGAAQAVFGAAAPLRFWTLVRAEPVGPGGRLHQRLVLPDAVLSFLIGEPVLDDALRALVEPIDAAVPLPADATLAGTIAAMLRGGDIVQVVAPPTRRALGLAAAALRTLDRVPFHLPLARLTAEAERDGVLRLWQRDRFAVGGALLISFETPPADAMLATLGRMLQTEAGPLILVGPGGQAVAERTGGAVLRMPLPPVDPAEVGAFLAATLDPGLAPIAGPALAEVAARFRLPVATLAGCLAVARGRVAADAPIDTILAAMLPLLRDQVREGLNGLADPVPVRMTLDDVVLPAPGRAILRQIVARHRQRGRVLDDWGFRDAGGGAQGMSVLFSGPSGTGKTMAAEALAQALDLDLFRVDLSRIVDKYIGETEKKLGALFDAADATDAILLFDEADALFGRRTDVRDSHDRYANLEVGYLLQRIERFRGIAVLTTNLPNAIDEAFARRFAFSLHFEFPTPDERREIWRRAIPAAAPTEGLEWDRLARLSLTGGQVRVVVVNAAMLAADEGVAIGMPHVARALTGEYAKQRRRVPPGDLAGWPT